MSIDVAEWLKALGLEQYEPAFVSNDIDGEVLPELTSDDLIGIGVSSIGHRRKLLAAVAQLRSNSPLPSPLLPGLVPGIGRGAGGEGSLVVLQCADDSRRTPLPTGEGFTSPLSIEQTGRRPRGNRAPPQQLAAG